MYENAMCTNQPSPYNTVGYESFNKMSFLV